MKFVTVMELQKRQKSNVYFHFQASIRFYNFKLHKQERRKTIL